MQLSVGLLVAWVSWQKDFPNGVHVFTEGELHIFRNLNASVCSVDIAAVSHHFGVAHTPFQQPEKVLASLTAGFLKIGLATLSRGYLHVPSPNVLGS